MLNLVRNWSRQRFETELTLAQDWEEIKESPMANEGPIKLYQDAHSRWLELFKKHWSKAIVAGMILATILVWSERLFGKKQLGSREDFIVASRLFERFQRGEMIDLESLLSAETILKNHPELKASYENMLARCFFAQNDAGKALLYANSLLERNKKELPLPYAQFGQATLLIAEEKLDEALEISRQLQAEKGSLLEAFNLLRLAMLGATDCWHKLYSHKRFENIAPLFQEGGLDLTTLHPMPSVSDHTL